MVFMYYYCCSGVSRVLFMAVSCTHADASCSDIDICCWKASDGDTTLSPIAPVLIGKAPVFLNLQ